MAPEISERVMLAPQIDPAGDFRNMILWPVRRGLTFIEMVTWNKVRFCAEIRGFPFFLNSWISLDMLAQQISCVCVCSSLGWRYAALSCSHGATHQCSRHYVIKLGIPGAANTRHGVRSIGSHRVGGTTRPHALPFEALAGRPRRWGMKSISWDVLLENEIVAGDHLQLQDATGRSTIKRIFWLL